MRSFLIVFVCAGSLGAAELKLEDVLTVKKNGPWQFWFEISHARGTFAPLKTHTTTLSSSQRARGIPRRVRGPIAGLLPNPKMTEGWIYHRDWDGRFEGVWADRKTKAIMAHPYVEKGAHCAVAITCRVSESGVYTISGKLTDLQVKPKYPKHDGILWRIETANGGKRGRLLAKGGPIGDGHGRPDSGIFKAEKVKLQKGELLRLVIHPNKWWGQDLTRIDNLKIEIVH